MGYAERGPAEELVDLKEQQGWVPGWVPGSGWVPGWVRGLPKWHPTWGSTGRRYPFTGAGPIAEELIAQQTAARLELHGAVASSVLRATVS